MHMLKRLDLKGYKSIKEASLELRPLNVFIGANGSGKSNLISFFKLMNNMMRGNLQEFIGKSGGANSLLHYGNKVTPDIEAKLLFEKRRISIEYRMRLGHAADDTLIFLDERVISDSGNENYPLRLGSGHKETKLVRRPARVRLTKQNMGIRENEKAKLENELKELENKIRKLENTLKGEYQSILRQLRIFQFHDTSSSANIRQNGDIDQNRLLMNDGGNLAAFLYKLQQKEPDCYQRIGGTIRQIAPFFGDFNLAPSALNPNVIQLRWKERDRDFDFGPHLLSDGTLRAMALVTLLLQPVKDLPSVIIIDEPELGLHPYALATLAGLLRSASEHAQIIVATESATLLDHFEPQDVVVTERCMGETVFKRLDSKDLQEWRDDYCLSELWEKNVIGGRPSR